MAHQGSGVTGFATLRRHVSRAYVRSGVKAAAAGVALDASSVQAAMAGNVTSATSPAFSPPAGSVIFVVVPAFLTGTRTLSSVTNTGTALTWALLARDNTAPSGLVEVRWAANASAQSGITVTANLSSATVNAAGSWGLLRVLVFTGAHATQNGATAVRNNSVAAAPSLAVTTSFANSWVWAAFVDTSAGATPTAGAAQSLDASFVNAAGGGSGWTQSQNAATATAGTVVTSSDSAPASMSFDGVAFEVKAA